MIVFLHRGREYQINKISDTALMVVTMDNEKHEIIHVVGKTVIEINADVRTACDRIASVITNEKAIDEFIALNCEKRGEEAKDDV